MAQFSADFFSLIHAFPKLSTSLHTMFAAETNLAHGEMERVKENVKEILKLQGITPIPVASKDICQLFVSP
jgi:hypothetical protein